MARQTGRAELDEHALGVNASELEAPFVLDRRSRDEFLADVRHRLGDLKWTDSGGRPAHLASYRCHAPPERSAPTSPSNSSVKTSTGCMRPRHAEIGRSIAGVEGIADISVEQQVERAQLKITPRREMLAACTASPCRNSTNTSLRHWPDRPYRRSTKCNNTLLT